MDILAKHVMQRDVKTVSPELSLADLERRFVEEKVSGFPVVVGSEVHGVVSVVDVLGCLNEEHSGAEGIAGFYGAESDAELPSVAGDPGESGKERKGEKLRVRDIMSKHVVSVSPDSTVTEAAALMDAKQIHRVLVLENDRLVGILSSLDIARTCGDDRVRLAPNPPKLHEF